MAFRQHLVAGVEIALLEALKENTDYEGLLGTDLTPGAPRFCPFSTHPSPSPTKSSGLPFRGIVVPIGPSWSRLPHGPQFAFSPAMSVRGQAQISVGSASSLPLACRGRLRRGCWHLTCMSR